MRQALFSRPSNDPLLTAQPRPYSECMGRPQRYLPGFIAAVLALGACSSTPTTSTVEAAPLVTTTTEALDTTTTQQVTTTVAPTTTSTVDPDNPFLQFPGGELVGAPMPDFDPTAETYADLERWLTDFDTLWVWINANPELVTDELVDRVFGGKMADQAKTSRDLNLENGVLVLSGNHFMGELEELIPVADGHGMDALLPQSLIAIDMISVQSDPILDVDSRGTMVRTTEGWATPSVFRLQLQQAGIGWRFFDVEFLGEASP